MNGGMNLNHPMFQRPGNLGQNPYRMGSGQYNQPQWSNPNWKPQQAQMPTQPNYGAWQPPIGLPQSSGDYTYVAGTGFKPFNPYFQNGVLISPVSEGSTVG